MSAVPTPAFVNAERKASSVIYGYSPILGVCGAENIGGYGIKKIVTGCPHCFNTLKNEYPSLGGNYEVIHHTQLIQELIDSGKLSVKGGAFNGKKITFHVQAVIADLTVVYLLLL